MDSDIASDLPSGSFSATVEKQTENNSSSVDAEALEEILGFQTQQVPPIKNRSYPYRNLVWGAKPLGRGIDRVQLRRATKRQETICWRCYGKGHISPQFQVNYETQSNTVIEILENLTFSDLGEVPVGA